MSNLVSPIILWRKGQHKEETEARRRQMTVLKVTQPASAYICLVSPSHMLLSQVAEADTEKGTVQGKREHYI